MHRSLHENQKLADQLNTLKSENEKLSGLLFLYESIFKNLPYGIQVFDEKGFSYKINDSQKQLLGIPTLEEGIGRFNVLTDPFTVSNGINRLFEKAYEGESFTHEFNYNLGASENSWNTRKDEPTFRESVFPIQNEKGETKYVVSVLSDITRLKQAEIQLHADKRELEEKNEEIQAQNEEYKRVIQELSEAKSNADEIQYNLNEAQRIAQVGNWYYALENSRLTWSAICYQIFDIPEHTTDSLNDEIKKRIHQANQADPLELMRQSLHAQKGFTSEISVQVKDQVKNILIKAECVFDENKQLCGFRGVLQDISEQKKIRQELIRAREQALESEQQFRKLLDNAPEPIYILIDSKFVYVNLATLKLYAAQNEQQILNSHISGRLDPSVKKSVEERLRLLYELQKPFNSVESTHLRLDGKPVDVEVSAVPIRFNNCSACLVIIKDIHEKNQAQKALKYSYDLMSYIIHHNRSAIAVHDRDLKYIFVSQRYLADYHITDSNIIGKHHYEVFPNLPQKWRDVHQRVLNGEVISAENDQYQEEDGTIEWTRWECRPWYEEDHTIGGIIVYTEVITDRIKMENVLKETNATLLKEKQKAEESEAQFRYLLDHAPVPMFIQTNSRFAYINNALISLYKAKDQDELIGKPIIERVHPEDIQRVKERIKTLNIDKKPVEKTEYKHICLDQSEVDIEVSAVPIRFGDSDGALVYLNDISRRKQAEEKLIESERILKLFVKYVPASLAMFDRNMCYLAVSHHYLKDHNLVGKDIIGNSHYELFPDLSSEWIETYKHCLKGDTAREEEVLFHYPDGKSDWIRWEIHPWYLENKEIGGIIVLTEVITERKNAEIKLNENRDLLYNLAEQVPGVIYQYRLYPGGKSSFPYSSRGMYDIYEVTSDEVRCDAAPVFTRIHPDDYNYIVDAIMESARTQSIFSAEFRVILPNQGLRWRSSSAKPQLLEDGSTLWHGIIFDITARKEIEQELELKNEELNTFFDCALDLLSIASTDGYFLRLNREWETLLGYSTDELMNKSFLNYIHPEDLENTRETLKNLGNQKKIMSFTNRYRCKSGEYKWIEWKSYPKGKKIYAAARDITARMLFENELEERIESRTKELLIANKELEAFSYSVSHDLRSPLRAIIGFTNILLEEYESKLDDEGKRICHVISSSAVNMGKLIDDLLSFSRIGRSELVYTQFPMKDLIMAAYNETTTDDSRQRIEFTCGTLPEVNGDFNLLKQVWINLISNSIKYSSQREKSMVSVNAVEKGDEIIFVIRDNGIGFNMEYVDKLFGVFQRLHNSKDFEGTGVGLAIVQRIIQRHGGKVWAEGEPEKGAAFFTSIPKYKNNDQGF